MHRIVSERLLLILFYPFVKNGREGVFARKKYRLSFVLEPTGAEVTHFTHGVDLGRNTTYY